MHLQPRDELPCLRLEYRALLRPLFGQTAVNLLEHKRHPLFRVVWEGLCLLKPKQPRLRPLFQTHQGVWLVQPQGTDPTLWVRGREQLRRLAPQWYLKEPVRPGPLKREKNVLPPKLRGVENTRWRVFSLLLKTHLELWVWVRLTCKCLGP